MTATDSELTPPQPARSGFRLPRGSAAIAAILGGLAVIGVLAVIAANRFAASEVERELRDWQTSLGIVAENTSEGIAAWAERDLREIEALAGNETVQLFFLEWEMAEGAVDAIPDLEAQTDYLRNLLTVSAERGGFTAAPSGSAIPANLPAPDSVSGLFIVDRNGRIIAASTRETPRDLPAPVTQSELRLDRGVGGTVGLRVVAPIYPLQVPPSPGAEVGYVLGQKRASAELQSLLEPPRLPDFTLEVSLLRLRDAGIEYLASSIADPDAFATSFALDTPDLAEAYAVDAPGGFAQRRDWRGREVLLTSRRVPGTDSFVMVTTARDAALGDIEERYNRFELVIWLFLGLLGAVIAMVWRHGASVRATEAMHRYRALATDFAAQKELLRIVTDSQPTGIFILDAGGAYRFANARVSGALGLNEADLIGKRIDAVLGPARAEHYRELSDRARAADDVVEGQNEDIQDGKRLILATEHIPLPAASGLSNSVLVVERDITDDVEMQERRERAQSSLIEALVSLVDLRDRTAANHSRRVGILAEILAAEMGLSRELAAAARMAGTLMNLGKILIPEDTLKAERLTDDERAQVRAGIRATAKLLADVPFDGPVLETLEQVHEHVDGSGEPGGMRDDQILITARLIAVANASVSMLSDRPYRPALSVEVTCAELVKNMGRIYDPGVVGALLNFVENKGGEAVLEARIKSTGDDGAPLPKLA